MGQKTLGVMLDCSRNAVMKVEKVKEFAKLISDMGYNMLQLYTEDTYEIDGEPYWGHMRGRYSKVELKEIDTYCRNVGVELVPCIQTLAHLGQPSQWEVYEPLYDCHDILLVGEPKVYDLIDKMFQTLSECFSSRRVNIGMDEAIFLGRGRYQERYGYRDRVQILCEHLARVKEIADKYGFQIMMWSDMFIRLHNDGLYYGEGIQIPQETINMVPEGVEIIYWDYYSKDKAHYDEMWNTHDAFQNPIGFAGGLWTWTGFAPNMSKTWDVIEPAMKCVYERSVNTVFFTMWGDGGKECSYFTQLPMLFAVSKMWNGVFDKETIQKEFAKNYGYQFCEFMKLELPNKIDEQVGNVNNPCKYLLYNDPFIGIFDSVVSCDLKERYQNAIESLSKSINGRKYDYLFEIEMELCKVLARKGDVGVRLRKAYRANDRETLAQIVEDDFHSIKKDMLQFFEVFRKMWLMENKPFGLEVQEARFGGILYRMQTCEDRIVQYLKGDIKCIEELEENVLTKYQEMDCHIDWCSTITTCVN